MPRIEAIISDVTKLPIKSSAIDIIICTETLEHLLNPHHAISEFVRVLKDGGRVIGSVPSKSLIWSHRNFLLTSCPVSEPFHRNYTTNGLKTLLRSQTTEIVISFTAIFGLTLFFVAEKPSVSR